MVSIEQKDIFLKKSGLIRIDQLLGMKDKNHLCLVQAEDDVILFEIWDMYAESVIEQKKINLYNYELSSNVITLESNQLAFYGVIQETGVQCLFLVDVLVSQDKKKKEIETRKIKNQQLIQMMIEEQQLDELDENNQLFKINLDNPESDILYRKDTAVSLNPQIKNKGVELAHDCNHYKQSNFKNQNREDFDANILDVDEDGNVELNENLQKDIEKNNLNFNGQMFKQTNNKKQFNSFDESNIQSLPVIEDRNLPLFIEQLENKQDMSLMNSFITQDFQGVSGINDLIEDINCINNFEYINFNRNEMLNYKEFLPQSQIKNDIQQPIDSAKEGNNLSIRDNFSLTNSNIKNHQIDKYAPDYNVSQLSSDKYQTEQDKASSSNNNNNNNYNSNNLNLRDNMLQQKNINFKTIFSSQCNNINQINASSNNQCFSATASNFNDSGIGFANKYIGEDSQDVGCIYDGNQRELFQNCIEFYSEVYGQGYHGIIIVKNTYYMVNYDETFYLLLVLSVYRTGNSQQFAQYIIRKDVSSNLTNSIQIICVQNAHQVIIYDPSSDELIVWSYFTDPMLPSYYTFQQFQSLQIKYCFQNETFPDTYHFVYKDMQSNMFKILSYDFKTGNNITKGFPNKELHNLRSPIIIKQQEAYALKSNKQYFIVIPTVYKNQELTTYWNVYLLNCVTKQEGKYQEGFLSQIHTLIESSETDNNDIKTHFVPNFSMVSPNIYFFNTSDIHINVQSAISTFIHNKDIHFKAITIAKEQ
ncbi:hypothetical protein ABPG73_020344 [Tetrahymena malaccensis]